MLGNKNTKLKVEDINVNELLDGLMDKLFDTIIKAVNGNTRLILAEAEVLIGECRVCDRHLAAL